MTDDIIQVAHDHPGAWTNIDQRGICIADDAAMAAAQGGRQRHRIVTGLSGSSLDADLAKGGMGVQHSIDFDVHGDGTVTMVTGGYEPVIEDGHITAFRVAGNG